MSLTKADEWADCDEWQNTTQAEAPNAPLYLQDCEADRVIKTIIPRVIGKIGNTVFYDAGEIISGDVVMRSRGNKKQNVKIYYTEIRNEDGSLDLKSTAGAEGQLQCDEFICSSNELLQVHFVFHGFRYFQVEGDADVLYCRFISENFPVTSDFSSDNITLDWLNDAFLRTLYGCIHGGVSTDSSNRERLGYTGDGQLCCEAALLLTDSERFYRKWMYDIFDCQDMNTGHVQHTAPFYGGGGGPGCWGGAVVVVPYMLYMKTGDADILREALPHIDKYMDYMENHSEDGLVVREEEGGWCLGDWCCPGGVKLPPEFVNTYYYLYFVKLLKNINKIITVESLPHRIAHGKIAAESMTRHFFDSETGNFVCNEQGANALAVDIGLGDERTLINLNEKYSKCNLDTGIVGTDVLLRVLFEKGYAQTAFHLLKASGFPSFEEWRQSGATTLWETWDGKDSSHAHQMFGGAVRYLYQFLLGIRNDGASGTYIVSPCLVDGLDRVRGFITVKNGKIAVSIDKSGDSTRITVEKSGNLPLRVVLLDKEYEMYSNKQTFCF